MSERVGIAGNGASTLRVETIKLSVKNQFALEMEHFAQKHCAQRKPYTR